MIKKQIIYKTYRNLSVRVLEDVDRDRYDIRFSQTVFPYWSLWHKNCDRLLMKELLQIYRIRAWVLQWLPPRLTHWLVTGS